MRKLFHELGIKQHDVEKAELSANTNDVDLKARAVLRWWKKTNGRKATRDVILEALERCQDKQTTLNLREQIGMYWGLENIGVNLPPHQTKFSTIEVGENFSAPSDSFQTLGRYSAYLNNGVYNCYQNNLINFVGFNWYLV